MKYLENYGVLEMDARESLEVYGGGKLAKWFGYSLGYIEASMENFSQWVNDQAV